jgi:hypothetical protein
MDNAKEYDRGQIIHGSFWLLPKIHKRVLKDCKSDHLQKKGVKFAWTSMCEEIFQQLKGILTSAPILNIPAPNEDFVVCIDACKEGLGGVLSQRDHVVCYESRKLKERERNYATHDLELATIVHALKIVVFKDMDPDHGQKSKLN